MRMCLLLTGTSGALPPVRRSCSYATSGFRPFLDSAASAAPPPDPPWAGCCCGVQVKTSIPGFYNTFKDKLRSLSQGCDTTVWLCLQASAPAAGRRCSLNVGMFTVLALTD